MQDMYSGIPCISCEMERKWCYEKLWRSMIEEALKIRAKLVDEAIPKFLPITPPDEMYNAMRHLLDAGGKRLRPSALLLSGTRSEPSRLVESLELMSKTCTDICEGQWMDMNFATRKDVTEAEYMSMVEKKTAVLFAAAMKMGATLSGATNGAVGKNNATRHEVSAALTTLKESGSIDYAMNKAVGFVDDGKAALKALPDSEAKTILIGLADYMIARKY